MTKSDDLHEELKREFEAEARDIKARERQRGQAIVEDARRQADENEETRRAQVERELEIERRRALSRARLEERNALLTTRREAIDAVIDGVRDKLQEMSSDNPERYGELLLTFFAAGRKLLPGKKIRVRLGPDAESCRQRLEKESGVEVVSDEEITGLILESADGRQRCDFSRERLLSQLRRDREAAIAEMLFEEDHD